MLQSEIAYTKSIIISTSSFLCAGFRRRRQQTLFIYLYDNS